MGIDARKAYIDSEYAIIITKKKGKQNSTQQYIFTDKIELLTGIASMTEQLILKGVLTKADILEARMGATRGESKHEGF